MKHDKRTKQETIELFRRYQHEYETQARRSKDKDISIASMSKAQAYEMAAFELEHNME